MHNHLRVVLQVSHVVYKTSTNHFKNQFHNCFVFLTKRPPILWLSSSWLEKFLRQSYAFMKLAPNYQVNLVIDYEFATVKHNMCGFTGKIMKIAKAQQKKNQPLLVAT